MNRVLDNACIKMWSPLYNKNGNNPWPTCDEMAIAEKFMTTWIAASGVLYGR